MPSRRRVLLRPLVALVPVAVLLVAAPRPAIADFESLTLYQMTARAHLVVRAKALSSSTRRPEVEVLDVLKGSYHGRTLRIAPYESDYTRPTPWLQREVFSTGEESILFLDPYVDEFGRDEGPHTFSVLKAASGKVQVPSEGASALLDAIRRFTEIQKTGQMDLQAVALRAMLGAKNPYLVEAGLVECRRFRLAQADDAGALLELLSSPRPDFRSGSLELLRQLVSSTLSGDAGPAATLPPTALSETFDRVAATSRFDAEPGVRTAAVSVVAAFSSDSALTLLDSIATADASQSVRYAAEVAAYGLRRKRD